MTIRKSTKRVLWYEAIGFGILIGLTWLDMVFPLPGLILQRTVELQKKDENLLISGLIAVVAIVVILLTWRLIDRLHRLEGLLRVCAWCGRISEKGQWLTIDEYFAKGFKINTSHGLCPDCAKRVASECSLPKAPPNPE